MNTDFHRLGAQFFANHSAGEPQLFVNIVAIEKDGWVQLAPFGDSINVDNAGKRIIQRFEKPDAENIVNEFRRTSNAPQQLLGLPWYIGHPDHERFKGKPGHTDNKAYGRIKKMEIREDGLYANVKFGIAGKQLLDDEAFHGHSVNWLALPTEKEKGIQIYRPVLLKSVGFTNNPNHQVRPASLSNEAELNAATFDEPLSNYAPGFGGADKPNKDNEDMIIPPKLKLIAGYKAEDDVTIEQVIAALETAKTRMAARDGSNAGLANEREKTMEKNKTEKPPLFLVNMKTDGTVEFQLATEDNNGGISLDDLAKNINANLAKGATALANEQSARKAERKRAATLVVDPLVKAGKIVTAERETKIEELCNAADFDAKANEFANAKPVVKTTAKTTDLAGKHIVLNTENASAQAKFEQLMNDRAQQFPNESYQDRWSAVCNSDQGAQLLTLMKRAGSEE